MGVAGATHRGVKRLRIRIVLSAAGIEHRPHSDQGAHVLLIEQDGTVNTGDATPSALTARQRALGAS